MFIKSIYIGAFAGKKNTRIDFQDKMNIIEGANESGKSTVAAFIKFIFFGLSGKGKGGDMSQRKRFIPFESNCAFGNMIVCESGRDYMIERRVTMTGKTSAKDEYKITDLETGALAFEGMSPGDAFIGMSETLFEKTAYVSRLTGAAVSGAEVTGALENLLFSAEESVDSAKAIKAIDTARAELLHKNSKGGKIYELECERDELTAALANAERMHGEYAEYKEQLTSLRAHYEENERLTKEAQNKINEYEKAKAILSFDKLASCRESLRKSKKALEEATERFGIPTNDDIHKVVRMSSALREKESQKNTAHAALDMFVMPEVPESDSLITDGAETVKAKLHSLRKNKTVFMILLLLSAVCAAVSATLVRSFTAASVTGALFLILFIIMAVLFVSSGAKYKSLLKRCGVTNEDELSAREAAANAAMNRRNEAEKHLTSLAAIAKKSDEEYESTALAAKSVCESYGTEFMGYVTLDSLADALSKAKDECTSLLADIKRQTDDCAERERSLSSYDENELRADPPSEEAADYDIKNLKSRFTFGTASRENMSAKITELERKLAAADIKSQNEEEMRTRISAINDELDELKERLSALRLSQEMLEEAAESMKNNVSPALAKRAGELLSASTDGKYAKLWISGDISLTYADGSAGGIARDAAYLSTGTLEAVYAALRIALCELLCGGKSIPMIFDESFSSVDEKRLSSVYSVIAARDGQCLIFTPHARDKAIATNANVIKL